MSRLILAALVAAASLQGMGAQDAGDAGQRQDPSVLFDIDALGQGNAELVGCEVMFRDVPVDAVEPFGFWLTSAGPNGRVFVLPAEGELISVQANEPVSIHGEVRAVTPDLLLSLGITDSIIYVYAYTVRPAAPR
jgi:hypothetical protein